MATSGRVEVRGLAELQRAFARMSKELSVEIRDELRRVAIPVQQDAANLAASKIKNIGGRWSRMRVGVSPGSVYVAPQARSHGGSPRPNLASLLMDDAMLPALEANEEQIVLRLEQMLSNLGDFNGF